MRKHGRLLAGAISVLIAICNPSGFVYAEDPKAGEETLRNISEYDVNNNNPDDNDQAEKSTLTYEFDGSQAEVAIVAWHQYGTDTKNGEKSAGNASVIKLDCDGENSGNIDLNNFYNSNKRGNLIVVAKAKPGYLITALQADGQNGGHFYPIRSDGNGNVTNTEIKYDGASIAEAKAYNSNTDTSGKYQVIFNFYRRNSGNNPKGDIQFKITTEPVGITVKANSDKTEVKIGDTVKLSATISPKEVSSAGTLSITLAENELQEKINDNEEPEFTNPTLVKNGDGTWTRTVEYTVRPEDVATGKIVYSITAELKYSLILDTVGLVQNESAEATGTAQEIQISTDTISIRAKSSEVTYDGNSHKENGVSVMGVDADEKGNASITVDGKTYTVSGLETNSPEAVIVGVYSNVVQDKDNILNKASTKFKVIDSNDQDVTSNFDYEVLDGQLKITPASLSLAQVPDVTYNGQGQTLNKAQEQVIANAVSYLKPVQSTDATNAVSVNAVVATNPPTPKLGKDYTLQYEVVNGNVIDAGSVLRVTAVAIEGGNYTGSSNPVDYRILARPLRVGTNSNSKIYDGKPLTAAGSIDGAVASDNLRLITTGSQTDVGSSQNTYRIDYGNATAGNYKVVGESIGTLTVYAPAPKPKGRTCQQDGYAAGYAWDDAQQACVLRVTETSPSIKNVPGTGALRK